MRKEIDRILGNSLRCILPSYWWKRLLGKMADKIESAESSASSAMKMATLAGREASDKQPQLVSGSNIKTINNQSILGSGNIAVNTERMEKYKTKDELDAGGSTDGGEIAAVVDDVLVEKSFTECYQPTSAEINANKYNTKFTKVDGLVFNPDFNPNLISSNYGSLRIVLYSDGNSKGHYEKYLRHLDIVCNSDRTIFYYEYPDTTSIGTGHRLYDSSGFNASNIDIVNNILREGNFRFSYFEVTYRNDINSNSYTYYYSYNANFPSDATAMIDNMVKMLFAETQNADIYVRSKEWEKLSKESIVTSTDELNNLVLPKGSIAQVTVGGLTKVKASELFLSLETAVNWDKYTIIKNIKKTDAFGTNQTGQLMLTNGEMSLYVMCSSETCYGLYTKDEVETQINIDEINQMLSEKDFRCAYVQPLNVVDSCLELYTQTPVVSDAYIKGDSWTRLLKEGDVTGGGADITIDSELSDISENPVQNKAIKAYVDTEVSKKADDSIIASIEQQIANKQDNLVSGTSIKTINGNSILGSGDIKVVVDTSNLATKSEVNDKQDKITDLETIRSGAAKGDTAIQKIKTINSISLSGEGNIEFYMSEIHKKLQDIKAVVLNNEEVLAAALNDINRRLLELENLSN